MARPRPPAPASRRKGCRRPEGANMTDRARYRPQAEGSLRLDQGSSDSEWTIEKVESSVTEPEIRQQLLHMLIGSWVARAISVAAKLRIADHLKEGARAAEELAAAA